MEGGRRHRTLGVRDVYLPAQLSVLAILALNYTLLSDKLIVGPRWGVLGLEALLLLGLIVTTPKAPEQESSVQRLTVGGLIVELARFLLHGGNAGGRALLLSGIIIWLTNIVLFALCYWQLDAGGPGARARAEGRPPDFLYPQMMDERLAAGWSPAFVDYLYLSFTCSTAFSPTDTMPLTRRAKLLMLVQAFASMLTLALVVSRAVNILA
jgi:hypothetical protein